MERRALLGVGLAATFLPAVKAESASISLAPLPDVLTKEWAAGAERSHLAGIAVSVVREGQPDLFWCHGHAELPFQTPVTRKTLFPIGSISKHVTAIGVLRLKEAGLLDLDDPISRHLTDTPPGWAPVTIRHLLTHTSGLANNWTFFPDWDRVHSRSEIIKRCGAEPLAFTPGSAWAYSNLNYDVLGWLIADRTGSPLPSVMKNRVFDPDGLPAARMDAALAIIPQRAEGYDAKEGVLYHSVPEANDATGAGGILFSGEDIPRWNRALETNTLISKESTRLSLSPTLLSTGRSYPYAFGWYLARMRGKDFHWHGGSQPGYLAQYSCFPALGMSVFVTINTFDYDDLDPSVDRINFQTVEHFHPGSTFLSLPAGPPADGRRGALLRRMLVRRRPGAGRAGSGGAEAKSLREALRQNGERHDSLAQRRRDVRLPRCDGDSISRDHSASDQSLRRRLDTGRQDRLAERGLGPAGDGTVQHLG